MIKKIVAAVSVLIFAVFSFSVGAEETEKPQITSSAYVLYNPDNDEIVDSKNATVKMYPASLTKMLTALTVMDLCDDIDAQKVTVSESAVTSLYGTGSSTANLKIGEVFTVRQLLYLMLLPSGNDAANALAEHFDSEEVSFVERMNQKAREIGMTESSFANPHGLHDDEHYTTAADLAILADAFIGNELLYNIAGCTEYTVPATNLQGERDIRTTNFMKIPKSGYYYEYATGLKTGNTDKAGRCLAASAEKDGVKYICILLDTPEVWNRYGLVRSEFLEASEIFKYAFENYECVKIADKGLNVDEISVFETFGKTVDLVLKEDVYATLEKGTDVSGVTVNFTPVGLLEDGTAASPVNAGQSFGKAELLLDGRLIGSCEVVAKNSAEPNSLIVFWHNIDLYVYIFLSVVVFLVLLFFALVIRKKVVLYRRKKAKEKRELHRKKLQEAFLKQEPYNYFKME